MPLLLAVRGLSGGQAFLFGLAYGFVCSATVANWLAVTMVSFFGFAPVAGRLAAAVYGLAFWGTAFGLFAAGAARLARARRAGWTIATAALWVATELLRGRVFGQPWCLLGYAPHASIPLVQLAAITAVYGLSFLAALGNAGVAEAIVRLRAGRPRHAWRPLALPAALTAAVWLAGARIVPSDPPAGTLPVALVQTNVPPAKRWTRAYTDRQIMAHAAMTDRLGPEARGGLVVWPENAVPRHLEAEPGLAALLGQRAARHGGDLLFGGPRFADGHTFNSVRLITASGRYGGHYDKQRLVLVAESDPFGTAPQSGPQDNPTRFTAGREPGVLRGVAPMGVSVCHEVLFPELAARAVAAGAELLVNVSNDGWLDPVTGVASRQHAAMAVFRAVETRRWLARAATTGISAVVDPYGRMVDALPPDTAGVLQARVAPRADVTPYVRLGDAFAIGCALVAAVALLRSRG